MGEEVTNSPKSWRKPNSPITYFQVGFSEFSIVECLQNSLVELHDPWATVCVEEDKKSVGDRCQSTKICNTSLGRSPLGQSPKNDGRRRGSRPKIKSGSDQWHHERWIVGDPNRNQTSKPKSWKRTAKFLKSALREPIKRWNISRVWFAWNGKCF